MNKYDPKQATVKAGNAVVILFLFIATYNEPLPRSMRTKALPSEIPVASVSKLRIIAATILISVYNLILKNCW